MSRFDDCLHLILNFEGGFSNDPADPGGATNLGIIQKEYDAYRTGHGLPKQSVKLITQAEAKDIYQKQYWDPLHAEFLAQPLDVVLFDTAVNLGVGRALHYLQNELGVANASTFDKNTSDAYHAYTAKHGVAPLATAVLTQRVAWYHHIGDSGKLNKFLKGWLNRVDALKKWAGM